MSLYIDQKFAQLVGARLERFKRKSDKLWTFRCPICGDSKKNKSKTRGYFYTKKNNIFFMCHNCHASHSLGTFLKTISQPLYREYILERYKNESHPNVPKPDFGWAKGMPTFPKAKPVFKIPSIDTLPDDHSAKLYLKKRKIPVDRWKQLYYADCFRTFIMDLLPDHDFSHLYKEEPRLVIPFYDEDGNLLGVQGRALSNSKVKYITIKTHEDVRKVYGLDTVDLDKTIYVVEGPIDSMFLPNSLATMDASLYSIINIVGSHDYVFVCDNEPRNNAIVKVVEKLIDLKQNVVIWPNGMEHKDINDMILAGMNQDEILRLIETHTYSDLRAKLEFERWRK